MIDYSDLIGVPFRNQGRDVESGLDCYGLVMEVYRRAGLELPEYTANFDDKVKICAIIRQNCANTAMWRKADLRDPPVPSVLAIRFGAAQGIINHTGVYIGGGKFIHTRANIGVCIDDIKSPAWRLLIEGAYEYIGK